MATGEYTLYVDTFIGITLSRRIAGASLNFQAHLTPPTQEVGGVNEAMVTSEANHHFA